MSLSTYVMCEHAVATCPYYDLHDPGEVKKKLTSVFALHGEYVSHTAAACKVYYYSVFGGYRGGWPLRDWYPLP